MLGQSVVVSLLALGQSVTALPKFSVPNVRRNVPGVTPNPDQQTKSYCPRLEYSEAVDGEKWQTGNSGPSGAGLSKSSGYTEGSIITIGMDLGLTTEPLLGGIGGSGGISFSYSETISTTVTIGNSMDCPKRNDGSEADYSCSLIVTPGFVKIGGRITQMSPTENHCPMGVHPEPGDWEMIVPRTDSGGNPFYSTDLCLCEGEGQDDENAPELKCLEACTG